MWFSADNSDWICRRFKTNTPQIFSFSRFYLIQWRFTEEKPEEPPQPVQDVEVVAAHPDPETEDDDDNNNVELPVSILWL